MDEKGEIIVIKSKKHIYTKKAPTFINWVSESPYEAALRKPFIRSRLLVSLIYNDHVMFVCFTSPFMASSRLLGLGCNASHTVFLDRTDISFVVNKVFQFMHVPIEENMFKCEHHNSKPNLMLKNMIYHVHALIK